MRIVMFYHSLVSDWNHGNAHFLRGVAAELKARGHEVQVYEPANGWSRENLLKEAGRAAIVEFESRFPGLSSIPYQLDRFDFNQALDGADLVIVHEWNDPAVVKKVGDYRRANPEVRVLFHDTHHRLVTAPSEMLRFDLSHYDGVLAFGETLSERYRKSGLVERVWTWHEAADLRVFQPLPPSSPPSNEETGDLVWIGNWGDDERSAEIQEFLIGPSVELGLSTQVYGVRYPRDAIEKLDDAGVDYRGWIPNFKVPEVFSRFELTMHIPRGPYVRALPGIPTIRVFEALACGIPLISAPWDDVEGLFAPGKDFWIAQNGSEMRRLIRTLIHEPSAGEELARSGLERIRRHHTCAHRVDELMRIVGQIAPSSLAQERMAV